MRSEQEQQLSFRPEIALNREHILRCPHGGPTSKKNQENTIPLRATNPLKDGRLQA
jgi:hypothetical protein